MRQSISNRAARFFISVVIGSALHGEIRAEDYINDAAIKASFETRLGELFTAGGLPKATETIRQLRAERISSISLPAADRSPNSPSSHSEIGAIVAKARLSTVLLGHLYLCGKCEKYHANLAGGVILSPDGLVLTNYHVLDPKDALVFGAMTEDGKLYPIDEVVASSKLYDLALVRLRGAETLPHISLCETVSSGEDLFVVSHPDGHFFTVTRGYLSRKYLTTKENTPRLQITADFAKGSSGSGIFNLRGELVGLATSTNSIYYKEIGGKKDDLQMVIKSGVPTESILKLFHPSAP